jgi:hypothetical protein
MVMSWGSWRKSSAAGPAGCQGKLIEIKDDPGPGPGVPLRIVTTATYVLGMPATPRR